VRVFFVIEFFDGILSFCWSIEKNYIKIMHLLYKTHPHISVCNYVKSSPKHLNLHMKIDKIKKLEKFHTQHALSSHIFYLWLVEKRKKQGI
jgi:hypothetical protein